MATCESSRPFLPLDLPGELSDVSGLVQSDLRAIVNAVAERAHARLLLTRREYRSLQQNLWNGLVASLNEVVQPLSVEAR
jgi:hypothetical protein